MTQQLSAKLGVILNPNEMEALDMGGLTLENEGAGVRTAGRLAVAFYNTEEYGGANLTVTPSVTATLAIAGHHIPAVPTEIVVPPGGTGVIGPFGREHENSEGEVEFTFAGEGGAYEIFRVR